LRFRFCHAFATAVVAETSGVEHRDDLLVGIIVAPLCLEDLQRFPGEAAEAFIDRIVDKVGSLLGGYSIGHVSGRFRASGLKTHQEAARIVAERGRYLVDETTAVVRFLLPLAASRKNHGIHFDVTRQPPLDAAAFSSELEIARRLFIAFFVESVILDIHGEDEIWFLESGPSGERLYVLEREREQTTEPRPTRKQPKKEQLDLPLGNPLDHWLRDSGYTKVADDIAEIVEGWRKNKLKTRRNWWAILAGDRENRVKSQAWRFR
jgi:hypothetical protein